LAGAWLLGDAAESELASIPVYTMSDRPPEPIGKRDSHDCLEE
jgi:hypothetical protein